MIVEAGPDAVEKVPGTTYRLTTGPPRPRAGESLTARALTQRVVLAMIKRPAAAGLPALDPLLHTFRATGITAYLSNGRISLESEFLVMPKGKGFVEFPVFEEGYEALKRGTGSFRNVTPDTVGRVVAETPIALIVLRCMLGFTPPEWAYYASRQDWRRDHARRGPGDRPRHSCRSQGRIAEEGRYHPRAHPRAHHRRVSCPGGGGAGGSAGHSSQAREGRHQGRAGQRRRALFHTAL